MEKRNKNRTEIINPAIILGDYCRDIHPAANCCAECVYYDEGDCLGTRNRAGSKGN